MNAYFIMGNILASDQLLHFSDGNVSSSQIGDFCRQQIMRKTREIGQFQFCPIVHRVEIVSQMSGHLAVILVLEPVLELVGVDSDEDSEENEQSASDLVHFELPKNKTGYRKNLKNSFINIRSKMPT